MYDDLAWRGSDLPRAVVAHRQPWFAQKVSQCLDDLGVVVLECLEDGADTMAAVVLHAPDLLVVGDLLPRVPAPEVVARTNVLAPATAVVVQVADTGSAPQLLDLGVRVVATRRVPPADVAEAALRSLSQGEGAVTLV
jgi:DNA-binding NarL/FixJ family response regulator